MEQTESILKAAAAEFAERGFGGARMDRIAERAEVNKASIYYHVGNKQELYAAVFEEKMNEVRERLEEIETSSLAPERKLEEVVETISTVPRNNPELPRMMMREVASGMENLPEKTKNTFAEFTGVIKEILEAGRDADSFRDVDPVLTLVTLMGGNCFTMVAGDRIHDILTGKSGGTGPSTEKMQNHLVELFKRGVVEPD